MALLTGVDEGGQSTPSRPHKSPVVLGGVSVVEGGELACEEGESEMGVDDEGHPKPNKAHESPVVLGGGVSVVDGGGLV